MSEKSATVQIRERQEQRAQQILGMLPDSDAVDVRLWCKDQHEVGLETGFQRGKSDTDGKASAIGAGVGVLSAGVLVAVAMFPISAWLWPWPWSAPVVPDCDSLVEEAVSAAVSETVSGGARVQLPWNETDIDGSTKTAPVEWVQIQGYSCVRETRTASFLCSPTPDGRTELPAVPVHPEVP